MSEFSLNLKICEFLHIIAQKQIQLQSINNSLHQNQDFDPFLAFNRIDQKKQQKLSPQDLHFYLESNNLFCNINELQGIYFEKAKSLEEMTYHDFLKIIGSRGESNFQNKSFNNSHNQQYIENLDKALLKFFDSSLEAYLIILKHREQLHENPIFNCYTLFKKLDNQKKGYVNFSDFQRFFIENQKEITQEQYQLILKHINKHQDKLSKKGFFDIFEGLTCKKCDNEGSILMSTQNISYNQDLTDLKSQNFLSSPQNLFKSQSRIQSNLPTPNKNNIFIEQQQKLSNFQNTTSDSLFKTNKKIENLIQQKDINQSQNATLKQKQNQNKQIFSQNKDRFSDEFFIDYKHSPSKSNFYKRDNNMHLEPTQPKLFLLGSQQVNNSVSLQTKSQQQSLYQPQQQYNNCRSPSQNQFNYQQSFYSQVKQDIYSPEKSILSPRKSYNIQKQLQMQNRIGSSIINIENQNDDNFYQQQFIYNSPTKNNDFLSSVISNNKTFQQQTALKSNLSQKINNSNLQTHCQDKKENLKEEKDVKNMVKIFLDGLDNLSKVEDSIEQLKCEIVRNSEFDCEQIFNFYTSSNFRYMGGKQMLDFYRDLKLIIQDYDSSLIIKRFDFNGDRMLNFCEFQKLFQPQNNNYKQLFFERIKLNSVQKHLPVNILEDILSNVQLKNNIKLLLDKLTEREQKYQKFRRNLKLSSNFDSYKLFNLIDQEENSVINFYEFQEFLKSNGFIAPNLVYLSLFNLFDKNYDGIITFSEFVTEINPKNLKKQ